MSIQVRATLIVVRLREMLEVHSKRTGERLTYQQLADRTGIARTTIESLATRGGYNASLRTVAKICAALGCTPGELLTLLSPEVESKKKRP